MRRSVSFMAWSKIFTWPVVGWLAHLGGAFPINLEHHQDIEGFRAAVQRVRSGRLLGIFPEAARAMGPLMEDAKLGAIRIALLADAAIVPVSLAGVHDVWPRRRRLPQPGKIAVMFHPAIRIQRRRFETHAEERAFVQQVMDQVRGVINVEIAARLRAWGAEGCVGESLRRLEGTAQR
jgi:1-acyl-sn-glycerol-3-phosphate acyltransferase